MDSKGNAVCAYRACSSRSGQGISLFSFPKDPARSKQWARACKREDLLEKNVDSLHRIYRLCEKHFEEKYISKGEIRKTIFQQAVPTLFLHTPKRELPRDGESADSPRKVMIVTDIAIVPPLKENKKEPTSIVPAPVLPGPSSVQLVDRERKSISTEAVPQKKTIPPLLSPSTSTQTPANLSSGTPRKEKLREKIRALRKGKKIAPPKELEYNLQDFQVLCDKFLSQPLAEIIKAQAELRNRKPVGRRYSMEYKQFSLTLYFLGPRAYNFMSKLLCLPTKRSLQRITEKLACRPGVDNEPIFSALQIKIKTMLPQDKHCTLCIDEMSLKSNLFYHTGRDEIVGLTDSDNEIAQNALVIMARGLYSNWKQPIAYIFTGSKFGAQKLLPLIEQCICKLNNVGLHVECLVSDMGSNFIELANCLGVNPDNPEFEISGTKLIYIFDTCHLIKATRNNLNKNIFCFDGKRTSWSYVEEFYNRDKQQFYRSAPKLTNTYLSIKF